MWHCKQIILSATIISLFALSAQAQLEVMYGGTIDGSTYTITKTNDSPINASVNSPASFRPGSFLNGGIVGDSFAVTISYYTDWEFGSGNNADTQIIDLASFNSYIGGLPGATVNSLSQGRPYFSSVPGESPTIGVYIYEFDTDGISSGVQLDISTEIAAFFGDDAADVFYYDASEDTITKSFGLDSSSTISAFGNDDVTTGDKIAVAYSGVGEGDGFRFGHQFYDLGAVPEPSQISFIIALFIFSWTSLPRRAVA